MGKILLPAVLCSILFFSCEKDSLQQDIDKNAELSTELEQLVACYEESLDGTNDFTLKGYQVLGEKDEITPTQETETRASEEIINYLKAKIDLAKVSGYSKTARADYPKPVTNSYLAGVFKITTCGSNREFVYFMDCEDGGWTNISNPQNKPFATTVDKNKNIEFHMCVVGNASYDGYVLALSTVEALLMNNRMTFIERYHDNEDHGNKNRVISGLIPDASGHLGPSVFSENTLFTWVSDGRGITPSLPFSYGVVSYSTLGSIVLNIDDENGKNGNFARHFVIHNENPQNVYGQWENLPYNKGWDGGFSFWENTGYQIAIR